MPHKEERKFSCICFGYLTCYEEEIGSTAYWQHKGAHTLLGCAVGAAKAGDCQSGAAGAVIGEIVAEELANTSLANNLLSPDAKKQANAKKTMMLENKEVICDIVEIVFLALACFFASGLNKLFAKLVLASSSATISPITAPAAPDWQSPAFAAPTAQPSKVWAPLCCQ